MSLTKYLLITLLTKGGSQIDFVYLEYQKDHLDINIDFFGREACAPNYSFGPSVRDNYVIHYILKGKGQLNIDDFSFNLAAGNIFILPKNLVNFYQADKEDPWDYIWVGLSGTKIENYLKRSSLLEDFTICEAEDSQFVHSFIELSQLSNLTDDKDIELLMDSKVYEMLYHLAKEFPSRQLKLPSQQQLYFNQAIKYIHMHSSQPITVKDICQHINLSRSYVHTIFTTIANMSPQEFLTNFRMKKAGDLLIKSPNTITTIAISVGYRDSLTFSKAFKKFYAVSPTIFREEKGNQKYERLIFELTEKPK